VLPKLMTRILALAILAPLIVFAETPCERLKSVALGDAVVAAAETVAAGPYQLPWTPPGTAPPVLPQHCRVALTMTPTSDSDIKAELWLPLAGEWNGKFVAVGNGGFAGAINYYAMPGMLREGYATTSTDTGHQGPGARFALGHPEKVVDFAYRAVHEMTVKAKAIISAHYGRGPKLSYSSGCSTGGRQGLMSAQRYPDDYDGIIASAPANGQIRQSAWRLALLSAARKDPARAIPQAKLDLLNRAVLAACDRLDGVKDGFLTDPTKCYFDPAALLCRGADGGNCLTAPQLESVRMAYSPLRKQNGDVIYPGVVPGGESGWDLLLPMPENAPLGMDAALFLFIAHQDPAWDWRTFDSENDTALALERVGFIEATNPDLSAFKARGGKLLIFHGWNDGGSGGAISALNAIDYYSGVLAKMGPKQDEWLRLFMVPGMGHCGGGPGPNQFNSLAALERWREQGKAPERIVASRVVDNRVDMTRPLCPYPKVAVYTGVGSASDAENFVCLVP
jgi:feruloyl esterase